jgi:hypothetical protein
LHGGLYIGSDHLGHAGSQGAGDLGVMVCILSSESRLGGHADSVSVFEPAYETAQQGSAVGRIHVLLSAAEGNGTTTVSVAGFDSGGALSPKTSWASRSVLP